MPPNRAKIAFPHEPYEYFAPELLNAQKYSKSADFWAVGVTLLELIGIESFEEILEKIRTG